MMWGDGSSAPEAKIELPALTQRVSDRQPERIDGSSVVGGSGVSGSGGGGLGDAVRRLGRRQLWPYENCWATCPL